MVKWWFVILLNFQSPTSRLRLQMPPGDGVKSPDSPGFEVSSPTSPYLSPQSPTGGLILPVSFTVIYINVWRKLFHELKKFISHLDYIIKRLVHSQNSWLHLFRCFVLFRCIVSIFQALFRWVSLRSMFFVFQSIVLTNFTDENSPQNNTKTAKRPHSQLKSAKMFMLIGVTITLNINSTTVRALFLLVRTHKHINRILIMVLSHMTHQRSINVCMSCNDKVSGHQGNLLFWKIPSEMV